MRIPFDLIAAILCIDRLGAGMTPADGSAHGAWTVLAVWSAFLFISWFMHDLAARLTEARSGHGTEPDGGGLGLHPFQFHTRCAIAAQALTVVLFAGAVWYLKWPAMVARWPAWFGLSEDAALGRFELARSMLAGTFLALAPFLAAMVLSWIPRRRLMSGRRQRLIPLLGYLSFEAKLSWLPLSLCAIVAMLSDVARFFPPTWTAWLESDLTQLLLLLSAVLFGAVILVPLAAVKLWKCEKIPDGPLKERLDKLLARSGVKTRAVLVWGGRGTGILNACVLGPWSRFRYVLISPLLADELSLDETEAVLGHELGHARYGHLTFYFVIVLGMSVLITALSMLPGVLPEPLKNLFNGKWAGQPLFEAGLTLAFMIAYIYFFFGALSRQCEREADLASAELMGTPQPLITALEKIASMNGNMRRVPCWHHGSIAERVQAVEHLSADPEAMRQFHARQKRLRIVLTLATLALIAVLLASNVRF